MQVGGAVPVPVQVQPPNTIDTAARILPAWAAHLEQLASDAAIKQASKDSNAKLKQTISEVRHRLEKLEQRLQEAIEKASQQPAEKAEQEPKPEQ